ncbi:MAG: HAD hydrolase family protein [Acetobacteraceae bacterium]|nr:HAD hydrolase family protein [Acetobacteraceae bacterium]
MARLYANEMSKLGDTFAWAAAADLTPLRLALRTAGLSPLRAIGSGGSLTAAHALVALHQRFTGRLAAVATPLEAAEEPLDTSVATWLLSAGGGNVDILAAAKGLISREPRQLGVLCGREDSPLAELCRQHSFVDLLLYPSPVGKDGFLATNSLLAFITVLTRAYAAEFGANTDWEDASYRLEALLGEASVDMSSWEAATETLWARPTTLVLHGPATRIGAVDLESKFTEAAIGNVQIADYRNFAHGRHHWLAKRGGTSGVLAFVTETDRSLAERTLDLIPADIPKARIEAAGGPIACALASLVAALRITGWAGTARGIDPGRPGVPDFGRKLYNLPLPRSGRNRTPGRLSLRQAAAISRKSGMPADQLAAAGELDRWRDALTTFECRLSEARFAGLVLDYDGTVVDTRHRFEPASPVIVAELARLARAGAKIAIATGRGRSVRHDLQKSVPRALWPEILIGYYNGAEIASLDDDAAPDASAELCAPLRLLAEALRRQPELAACVRQEDRAHQITLEATRMLPESRLWDLARQVILTVGTDGVNVTRSSHSVDIVAAGVSKLNVVSRLREWVGDAPILAIGDRGRWPGNDYDLLREPFALGVDEISVDPATCWHLGEPGQRGPSVTLDYLKALGAEGGRAQFAYGSFR